MNKKVCVVGLGYIGLPTACTFADAGFEVLGVDVNPRVVESINRGDCHLDDEPGLPQMLAKAVKSGKLRAALKPETADLYIIAVPTPFKEDHKADLTYVEAATASIVPMIRAGNAIALESTSPPRTTENIVVPAVVKAGFKPGVDVAIAYCPERVLPGQILRELKTNARIVGGITAGCAQKVADFYRAIVDAPIHQTLATVAETSKLVENSFRDVNIAFANEVSLFCAELGIDHREVIQLANHHPRVKILNPGPGVGGHCIAVDPWFLVEAAPSTTPLIRTAREVNLAKTEFVVERIKSVAAKRFKETGKFQTILLHGMAYKPNVADFRESPAVEIYHSLSRDLGNMAEVLAVDPYLDAESARQISVRLAPPELPPARISVLLVRHQEFADRVGSMDLDYSV